MSTPIMFKKPTYHKIILSGLNARFYRFSKGIYLGTRKKSLIPREKNNSKIIKDSLSRSRKNISLLLESNPDMNKFITLTYSREMKDEKRSYNNLKNFIKRLRYYSGNELKYLAVQEYTKRKNIHYHIISNIEYIRNRKLAKIWSFGFVKINKIRNFGIVPYLMKYLNKNLNSSYYKHRYYYSKNLERPFVYYGYEALSVYEYLNPYFQLVDKKTFTTDRGNNIKLKYYKVHLDEISTYLQDVISIINPTISYEKVIKNISVQQQLQL